MAKYYDLDGLVTVMTGEDTLLGWDVLVSYDEQHINDLLLIQANANNELETIPAFQRKVPGKRCNSRRAKPLVNGISKSQMLTVLF